LGGGAPPGPMGMTPLIRRGRRGTHTSRGLASSEHMKFCMVTPPKVRTMQGYTHVG